MKRSNVKNKMIFVTGAPGTGKKTAMSAKWMFCEDTGHHGGGK
jgi:type IV secretory pathway ATPase VirB11/archaellum biosynthesis ATPase